jgi:Protein of unknown function (DUF3105)
VSAGRVLPYAGIVSLLHLPRFLLLALTAASPLVAVGACGDDEPAARPATDASVDRMPSSPEVGPAPAPTSPPPPLTDAGECHALVEAPSVIPSNHLDEGTPIGYTSNPPSSGPHYPRWANFQEYTSPVPPGYLVHSLEHGAVLLAYKCDALDAGDCNEVVAALRGVRDSLATDPTCDPSIRVRIIIAPMPTLDVPVAAAAWGFTYKAQCVDVPSLTQFVQEHYAKGPEDFCSPGIIDFLY